MSKKKKFGELITDNKENAAKLTAADIKATSDKDKTEKKISKLILDNKHISNELDAAYKIIVTQEKEIKKQAEALIRADKEKEKQRTDLISAHKELAHKAELIIVNEELNLQITERKKSEEVVNLQKIKLELALQSSQMGTWEFNIVENKHIFDNQTCILLGIDSATFGGTAEEFFAAVHPDDHEKVKRALKKTSEQIVSYGSEFRTIWRDGSIHNISARGNLLFDDKGKPQMISGIIWDNTENKLKEEALKNSEARYDSMMSNISDVISVVGADGLIKYKSPNVEKWFGWQPQDLIGTDGFLNVHPDDFERIQQELVTPLEKKNLAVKAEFRYRCKDGSYKPIELNAINLTHDPFIKGILLNFHDITNRKMLEDRLLNSERYLKETQVIANLGTYKLDIKSGKWTSSEVLDKMLGIDSDYDKSIEGRTSLIHPEWQIIMADYLINEVVGNKTNYNKEYLIVRKNDKAERWVHGIGNLKFDGNDQPIEMIGTVQDITEQKNAEQELIEAKEKAEESDRLKSAFLTNMSHEIRTPMNGILGFTDLLQDPNLSSENKKDFMQIIRISSARMLNTINSIVNMSKIESGLIKVDINETNINEKIEFIYKFLKPEVETKGLQFLFKNGLPTNEAIIKTDDEKVGEILTNLVRNAIKFTGEGSIDFGYVLKSDSEPAELEFFVKDTGIGIPQKQQQLIFERFRQGSESHNRGYEGSGLGLSISKYYVEMLGGKIWVESEEDSGSTFYFTIPYNPASEIEIEVINAVSVEHKEVTLENMKILIVEDNEISFTLLKLILNKISKEVLHANTGAEAVETCRNNPDIDLILMDIRMPRMNGLEATQKIRQFNKEVIIIAQTAYAFLDDSEKAIEAGCNDYITKPINRNLLIELIKKHWNI